jgi:hypothetical protein
MESRFPTRSRLPIGDTAECHSALRPGVPVPNTRLFAPIYRCAKTRKTLRQTARTGERASSRRYFFLAQGVAGSKSGARLCVQGLRRRGHWGRAGADVAAQRPYLDRIGARASIGGSRADISLRENDRNPTPNCKNRGTRLFAPIFFRAVPAPIMPGVPVPNIASAFVSGFRLRWQLRPDKTPGQDAGTRRLGPNRSFECGWEGWGWLGKLCEGYAARAAVPLPHGVPLSIGWRARISHPFPPIFFRGRLAVPVAKGAPGPIISNFGLRAIGFRTHPDPCPSDLPLSLNWTASILNGC